MEKEQVESTFQPRIPLWRWLAPLVGMIAALIVFWAIGFNLWLNAGSVKSSLDTEYVPTAEYLLENPYEEPSSAFGELKIELNSVNPDSQEICFTIWGSSQADFDRASLVEVFINEQFAARIRPDSFTLTSLPAQKPFCIHGSLDSGLHIIEVKAYSGIFAEPNYIHRWATELK